MFDPIIIMDFGDLLIAGFFSSLWKSVKNVVTLGAYKRHKKEKRLAKEAKRKANYERGVREQRSAWRSARLGNYGGGFLAKDDKSGHSDML